MGEKPAHLQLNHHSKTGRMALGVPPEKGCIRPLNLDRPDPRWFECIEAAVSWADSALKTIGAYDVVVEESTTTFMSARFRLPGD